MAIKVDHSETFDSLGAFADAAAAMPGGTPPFDTDDKFRDFSGTASMEEAVKLAHTGWSTHRETFSVAVDAFAASHGRPTFSTTFDVAGAWVDVDRFLSGEPECMVQPVLTHEKPIVRIAINGSVPWYVDAESIVKSGGIVTGLVDVLTAAGNAVELWWVSSNGTPRSGARRIRYFVKVKAADQPCDLDQVAFAMAHPSMLRRLKCAVMDGAPKKLHATYRIGVGYGTSGKEIVDHPDGTPFDLYLPDISSPANVMRDCVRFLEAGNAG